MSPMRAITIEPRIPGSARLDRVPEPSREDGAVLVRAVAMGVCGTDMELVRGEFGDAPPGSERLILGHESLGTVVEAPPESGFHPGQPVVGIVRRPDPVPCANCAAGEWDMCRNGLYTERGIKGRHGFGSERFRLEPEFAVKVDRALGLLAVLLEPTSIVAKAFDHAERIAQRARSWRPQNLLVTGAGPIGLLAALMGKQRGLDVHVFDRNREGIKPALIRDLDASHHPDLNDLGGFAPDIIMECTGAITVVKDVLGLTSPGGIVCLLSVTANRLMELDIGAFNRKTVLDNDALFGAVNANLDHYRMAADALAKADRTWLERLITRRVPLDRWSEALEHRKGDIKSVIDFAM